jgi:hypothetical protein
VLSLPQTARRKSERTDDGKGLGYKLKPKLALESAMLDLDITPNLAVAQHLTLSDRRAYLSDRRDYKRAPAAFNSLILIPLLPCFLIEDGA